VRGLIVVPESQADTPPRRGSEEGKRKVTQRRGEENERDRVLGCRDMGMLPMIPKGPASSGMPCGGGCSFRLEGHSRTGRPASRGMLMLSHSSCTGVPLPHP